jgi:hypothetical protein
MNLEDVLGAGEDIRMEAEAFCKIGLVRELFGGRAYLTTERVLWVRRSPWLVGWLFFRAPKVLAISLNSIKELVLHKELGTRWITFSDGKDRYAFRLGRGPYPLIRDHKRVTEQWFQALRESTGESGS